MSEPEPGPDPESPNFITPLRQAAASMFEFYAEYVAVGFTPEQALYLVAQIMTAGMRS